MNHRTTKLILVIVALLAASLACSFSTANISDAYMAFDIDGNNPTEIYSPDDTFFAIVDLANAPDGTELRAEWVAQNVDGYDPDFFIDAATVTDSSGGFYFDLSNDSLWPSGTYRVDLYLNGELETSLVFLVQ